MHNLSLGNAKNVIPILLVLFWHVVARKNIKPIVGMLWVCFLYSKRDMHLLSKVQLEESYTSTWSTNVKLIIHLADNHDQAYAIYHLISYAFMILICAYACNRFPRRSDATRVRTRASGGAAGSLGVGG